jgi:hypothetical protein
MNLALALMKTLKEMATAYFITYFYALRIHI